MTEQKLQKLSMNYGQQKQSGWYMSRLAGVPSTRITFCTATESLEKHKHLGKLVT